MDGSLAVLWADQQSDGASFAPSHVDAEKHGTGECSKVASFSHHPRLSLASARATLRKHAREVIFGAFPGRSRRAVCLTAAQACGTSPDTIERLIEGETSSPDVLILGFCARIYRDRTGKVSPICTVLAQVIAAEVRT